MKTNKTYSPLFHGEKKTGGGSEVRRVNAGGAKQSQKKMSAADRIQAAVNERSSG
jgi:hypothetical protein